MRVVIAVLLLASSLSAQEPQRDYRWYFQQGEEAAKRKDPSAAIASFEKALELNTKPVNRPWYMYLLARQNALAGSRPEAVRWLARLWDDGVESLMVSYAEFDPAFDEVRKTPEYAALMKRVASMKVSMKALAGPLHLIEGAGCALVASIGPDGVLLVDSGYEKANRAISAVLGKSPRVIINTHAHEDHVAGNKVLGRNATILAHPNARAEMMKENPLIEGEVSIPAKGAEYLPNITAAAPVTLYFNGEEVRIVPLPSHTSGDLVVLFTRSQVLHMGDDFFPSASGYIFPGETMASFFTAFDPVVAELSDDAWVVVGHEPAVRGRDLKRSYAATKSMRDFVIAQKNEGRSLEAIQEAGAGKNYPAGWLKYFYGQSP